MDPSVDHFQTDVQPKGITKQGKAPEKRIGDANDARRMVTKLVEANAERARFNAQVQGMFDGHPPYNKAKLRNSGQAYRCNVNFMEAESALRSACVPYYDLFSGANEYMNIETREGNVHERTEWSRIITEEANETLKSWAEFDFSMQALIPNFVGFGKGFFFWPDKHTWHYRQVHHMRVYTLDGTRSNVDELEVLLIRQELPVHMLWKYTRSDSNKWNRDAIAKACYRATTTEPIESNRTGVDYETMARKIKDRDLESSSGGRLVKLSHLFVKEFDGKVSHYIIEEANVEEQKDLKFIYMAKDEYDHFRQAISAFFFETLDGSWNGASGLGRSIYSTMEIKNRLRCSAIDNTFLRSGVVLQANDANSLQKTSMIQVGGLTIIPPGYDVQNGSIFTDISGPLEVNRDLENMISTNTGIYRQRMDKPTGNPRTAEEVRLQFMSTAVLNNSAVNRFYLQLDRHYAEVYRRMSADQVGSGDAADAAREFQKRCKDRGVPRKALTNIRRVMATRAVGNGSQFMRQQQIAQLQPYFGLLPATGQQHFIRDVVSSTVGAANADRYAPIRGQDHTELEERQAAMVENAAFKSGTPVPTAPTDNHSIHADTHMAAGASGVQSLEQGADLAEVIAFLDAMMPHAVQHIQQIGEEEKRKALEKAFNQLAGTADELKTQMAEHQEAQAEAQAITTQQDPDTAVTVAKARQDMQIKAAEHEQEMQHDAERHRQLIEHENQKMALKATSQNSSG